MRDYEVVVIGAGPGGYVCAIRAAQLGKKVCIVQEGEFGGTCLNIGCIPTKTLIKTAQVYETVRNAGIFGIEGIQPESISISMQKLQQRKKSVIGQLTKGVRGLLRKNGVVIEAGRASFVDAHTLAVGERRITSDHFVIATGSEVFMPPFIELQGDCNVLTSTEALELDHVPSSMAIIGGGVIGVEFAYLLNKLGCSVTVLELMDHIIPMVDREISGMAQKHLEKAGVAFCLGAKVSRVENDRVHYELNGEQKSLQAEAVLMAVGRVPRTEGLNAQGIGLEFDRRAIKVDENLCTNIPNIYAVGDVNGKVMLAHTASKEGAVAAERICGKNAAVNYRAIPSCIYIEPEIASVGLTEEEAKANYPMVKVGRFPLAGNGKALVEGASEGMIKVILDERYGEILGAHIYGCHATDMIAEIALAISSEATANEVIGTVHPHPTISEAIPEAFMNAFERAIHI